MAAVFTQSMTGDAAMCQAMNERLGSMRMMQWPLGQVFVLLLVFLCGCGT